MVYPDRSVQIDALSPVPERVGNTDPKVGGQRSIDLRVNETQGLEPLLAFLISVPKEELEAGRALFVR